MMAAARIVSWLALAGTIVPAWLFFTGVMSIDRMQTLMLLATVGWFAAAPMWMERRR